MNFGFEIPIKRVIAIEEENLRTIFLKMLNCSQAEGITIVIFCWLILRFVVINGKRCLTEGKEFLQPADLAIIFFSIGLGIALQQTGGEGEIQAGAVMQH